MDEGWGSLCEYRKYSWAGYFLMWKRSWRGNLKGEVCQGHTRARSGKQKQDGSQADMEHSGAERALTEKVSDSVTVGNRVLPLGYLCCSCSERGRQYIHRGRRNMCVHVCSGVLVLKAFYDALKPACTLIGRTFKKIDCLLFNCRVFPGWRITRRRPPPSNFVPPTALD